MKRNKFINTTLIVYLGSLVFSFVSSIIIKILGGSPIATGTGNWMLYGGVFLFFFLGFMYMGSTRGLGKREISNQSAAQRERKKLDDLIALAISSAGILVSISGYIILYFT